MSVQWPGGGMNYGHQAPHNPYNVGQVTGDLRMLAALGVTKLRIAFCNYNASNVQACQDLCVLAKQMGFYVVWGLTSGGPNTTASQWASFKTAVQAMAGWAAVHGIDQFSVGNEEELHADDTTLTVSQVQADIPVMVANAKTVFNGTVSYETDAGNIAAWVSSGKGALDKIGFNLYGSRNKFRNDAQTIAGTFGSGAYVSEWSTSNGITDSSTEVQWVAELRARAAILQQYGLADAYYFALRDGSFGLPADAWALCTISGGYRLALADLAHARAWYATGQVGLNRSLCAGRLATTRSTRLARQVF